jgi:hypothetical protein
MPTSTSFGGANFREKYQQQQNQQKFTNNLPTIRQQFQFVDAFC